MRVLVGPRADAGAAGPFDDVEPGRGLAADAARALAGPRGDVISLGQIGVGNLSRSLSAAEVALLREALKAPPSEEALVGYVCLGATPGPCAEGEAAGRLGGGSGLVAVSDHVNLTWRSPLTGPNDDAVGPRFPSMTGIYAPEMVVDRLAPEGIIVRPVVVAGVSDDHSLNAFEVGMEAYQAASSELVPVAIVAAHMGVRLAAVVVLVGS